MSIILTSNIRIEEEKQDLNSSDIENAEDPGLSSSISVFSDKKANESQMAGFESLDNSIAVASCISLVNEAGISIGSSICLICQSLINSEDPVKMPGCLDTFCRSCLNSYLKIRIEECQVLSMPCPMCLKELDENFIGEIVSPFLYEKYLIFRNNEELSKNPFLRWCPQPECKGYDFGSLEKSQLACNTCDFKFCYYCGEPWHRGQQCKASNDQKLDKWARSHGIKYCPNCRRKVEKTVGCDHMTCPKCKHEWCWLCGEKFSAEHNADCEVKLLVKKDPPMKFILICLFSPLILPFLCVIICVAGVKKNIQNPRLRNRFYPLAVLLGLILTPIFFALAPLVASCAICLKKLSKTCRNFGGPCVFINGLILGIIGTPVLVTFILLAVVISHILGLALIIRKLWIIIKRHKDPNYLKPTIKYGYV